MTELLVAIGGSIVASVVLKATGIALMGLLLALMLRRSRASLRHAVLAATFAVLLVLPVVALLAPPLKVAAATSESASSTSTGSSVYVAPVPMVARVAPVPPRSRGVSAAMVLWSGWSIGVAVFLLPMMVGLWRIRRLRRSAVAWAKTFAVPQRVEVLVHPELAGPMACGIFRPAIILPSGAEMWCEEDVNRALVHELDHLRRGDLLTQYIARTVCAIYWFHPLVWIAWRKLVLEAERSCDDAVLAQSEATAYAEQLVTLAQQVGGRSPVLAMANRADLKQRVRSILDGRRTRGRAGLVAVALTWAIAGVLVASIGPLRVVAAPQAPPPVIAQAQQPAPVPLQTTPPRTVAPRPQSIPAPTTSTQPLSSTTELVMVSIVVTDADGKNAIGLASNNFVLTENGIPQYISVLEYQMDSDPPYYAVGYYPTNQTHDGKFRRIEVKTVGRVGLTTGARIGYYEERRAVPNPAAPAPIAEVLSPGGITLPQPIYRPEPEYSEEARRAKWAGTVRLSVRVSATGDVSNLTIVRPLGFGLDEKAIEAVRKWKFQPAEKDGRPIASETEVDVAFHLL